MKLTIQRKMTLGVIAVAMGVTIASAAEPLVTKDQVAALLDYPATGLQVTDSTEARNTAAKRKGKPLADSAHLYRAIDNSCAPLSIIVGDAGSLLTQEKKDYVEKGLAASFGSWTGLRKIAFDRIGEGMVGTGGMGPGGYTIEAIVTIPVAKKDVQVVVSVLGDGQLVRVPGAERHYALLLAAPALTERLVQCVEIAAKAVVAASIVPEQALTNIPQSGGVVSEAKPYPCNRSGDLR